jgi:hypothetical protein
MADEIDDGAAAPADDLSLRDEIARAVAINKGEPEPPAPEPQERTPPAAPEPKAPAAKEPAKAAEGDQARDAQGRFVKSEGEPPKPPQAPGQPRPGQPPAKLVEGDFNPPHSWSATAKSHWQRLPQQVREAVAARENEVAAGQQRLQQYADIDPYAEAAQRSGTTLANALKAYTGIEDLFRRDPAEGFIAVMRNIPMNPAVVLREVIRRLGGAPVGPAPGGAPNGGLTQPGGAMGPAGGIAQLPPELLQQMQTFNQFMQDSVAGNQRAAKEWADQTVAQFWADPAHKYADNVAPQMLAIINMHHQAGHPTPPLQWVYDEACWMVPEVRELLIAERALPSSANGGTRAAVAAQARAAAKATTGAPARGHMPAGGEPPPAAQAISREEIRWAIDRHRT